MSFVAAYPSVEHLRDGARRRLPRFAFEYLDGGCHHERNLRDNTEALRRIRLGQTYLREPPRIDLSTELFGHTYAAPFGVAPIGLQGLMWPRATEILAAAAHRANIPFVLSTVATGSLERVAELTEGRAWFQLYHPVEDSLRDALLERLEAAGISVLVLLADTPSFGYRPKEIRNGLALPPRMTLGNIFQMLSHPRWSFGQLRAGAPGFATLAPYLPARQSLKHLGEFMNRTFSGRLSPARIAALRDRWKGRLVVKGVASEADAEQAARLGVDGVIVSNHGGRQHDHGEASVTALERLVAAGYGERFPLLLDSGIRSGADVASGLAAGAQLGFLGRSFMYGVGALGDRGGEHVIAMLLRQLEQVMEQVGCERPTELADFRL